MHRRTWPLELLLLIFFAVFLLYPLAYVIPGSASDDDYHVRLTSLPEQPEQKAQVVLLLHNLGPAVPSPVPLTLPQSIKTFPGPRKNSADQLAEQLRQAGAQAEVVRERHWTAFYFQQALGFRFERAESFPFFRLEPNSPSLWECLRNSLALGLVTTLATTLLCMPLAHWFTRYRFRGRGRGRALCRIDIANARREITAALDHLPTE